MPLTLQNIFDLAGQNVYIEQSTYNGFGLTEHLTYVSTGNKEGRIESKETMNATTVAKLLSRQWDYVVLQEGTVGCLVPELVKYTFTPAVVQFDSLIKSIHGRTVLFQPFSLVEYPKKYCFPATSINIILLPSTPKLPEDKNYCSFVFWNSKEEFKKIEAVFADIASKTNAVVSPVGEAFEAAKIDCPEINLYMSATNDHPSIAGSYLIACVFYRVLTGKKANSIQYFGDVRKNEAIKLQKVADKLRIVR